MSYCYIRSEVTRTHWIYQSCKNSLILTGNDNYSYDNLTPPTAGISDRLFSSVSHIELFSLKLTGNNNIHFIKKKDSFVTKWRNFADMIAFAEVMLSLL